MVELMRLSRSENWSAAAAAVRRAELLHPTDSIRRGRIDRLITIFWYNVGSLHNYVGLSREMP
jgi:hypothetical protein